MFRLPFITMPFSKTPFAEKGAWYPVMSPDEAVQRYSIHSDTWSCNPRKDFILHRGGRSERKTVIAGNSAGKHLLRLRDAYVVEKAGVFTEDGFFLPPAFASERSRFSTRFADGRLSFGDGLWNKLSGSTGDICRKPAFYADTCCTGYGHFLLEALPRCWALPLTGNAQLLLSAYKSVRERYARALPVLGLHAASVKKFDKFVFCRELYVASQPVMLRTFAAEEAGQTWRAMGKSCAKYASSPGTAKKIFISRAGIEKRSLDNQQEIEALFKQLGFLVCKPELLSLTGQAALFAGATHVACLYGSGMFNALFAQQPVSLFIIAPGAAVCAHFLYFDALFSIEVFLDASADAAEPGGIYRKHWRIHDMEACREAIRHWARTTGA